MIDCCNGHRLTNTQIKTKFPGLAEFWNLHVHISNKELKHTYAIYDEIYKVRVDDFAIVCGCLEGGPRFIVSHNDLNVYSFSLILTFDFENINDNDVIKIIKTALKRIALKHKGNGYLCFDHSSFRFGGTEQQVKHLLEYNVSENSDEFNHVIEVVNRDEWPVDPNETIVLHIDCASKIIPIFLLLTQMFPQDDCNMDVIKLIGSIMFDLQFI